MSQPPPLPPPQTPPPAVPPYDDMDSGGMPLPAKIPGIAITALVLGIIGLLCAPVGIVGLILGILALVKINGNPRRFAGSGFAITGIVCGALGIPLSIAILLPSLSKAREFANRSTCAANLAGISRSMISYADANNDFFPYISPSGPSGAVTAQKATDPASGGVMFDMFTLVGNGSVGAKQFICKSDPANTAPCSPPTTSAAYPFYSPTYWNGPAGADFCYSYSFANPFSAPNAIGTWWKNLTDAGVPLAADMNPGTLNPDPVKRNSMNHQADGQNVGFGDGHVQFVRTPACGEDHDNIYSLNSRDPAANGMPGSMADTSFPPTAGCSDGSFDTWLVPAASGSAYTRQ